MTTTSPFLIFPSRIASDAASSESNTRAGPSCRSIPSTTADCLTTQPFGARLPNRTASPPLFMIGVVHRTDDGGVKHPRIREVVLDRVPGDCQAVRMNQAGIV